MCNTSNSINDDIPIICDILLQFSSKNGGTNGNPPVLLAPSCDTVLSGQAYQPLRQVLPEAFCCSRSLRQVLDVRMTGCHRDDDFFFDSDISTAHPLVCSLGFLFVLWDHFPLGGFTAPGATPNLKRVARVGPVCGLLPGSQAYSMAWHGFFDHALEVMSILKLCKKPWKSAMMIHDARCAKPEVVKLLHRAMNPGEAPPKSSSKSAVLIEQAMIAHVSSTYGKQT